MSVKSMTGYGHASTVVNGVEVSVDVKSVNHRFFDFNAKLSKDQAFLEDKIKSRVNSVVTRGKIDVYLFVGGEGASEYTIEVDEKLAAGYASAFAKLSKSLKIKNGLKAADFMRFPDVVTVKKTPLDEQIIESSVMQVLDQALESYDSMRAVEGEKLHDDVSGNLDAMIANVTEIERLAPESIGAYKERLKTKMLEALEGKEFDEQRLITEVAVFADKVDVGEETVRLRSHVSQFRSLIDGSGAPVGKKLDFIVQEMNREVNTIGSKCSSIEITQLVVDTKSIIEKIREQIQNIE